ncbi:hypothetical protein I316_00033 [Kwoniella heveanensis BCC8398]|uniref:Uncharacterized protein n=1 Tax=Kwoniella heveanensis BCC8398 TaxID=1296120 RepID=A0A1B9H3H2_9TREE|nr:hypothetical protein I316_00033 [Kwoniella heveanensis BCC8398]
MKPSPTLIPRLTPLLRHTPTPVSDSAILYPAYTVYSPSTASAYNGTSGNDYRSSKWSERRSPSGKLYGQRESTERYADATEGWGDWWVSRSSASAPKAAVVRERATAPRGASIKVSIAVA